MKVVVPVKRVNTTMDRELRDRFEAWRADQYVKTGRIPALADAARILIHKGLVADGFGTAEWTSENWAKRQHVEVTDDEV